MEKNSATQNTNLQKQFPSALPFFTTKPLETAVINRQLLSISFVVACSESSCSITGHSCFALAIKVKVTSFKRAKWGSAVHTYTFRWRVNLPSTPKSDMVPACVREMDPMTTLHLNRIHTLTRVFLCPPEAFCFSQLIRSLNEVKVCGKITHSYLEQNS